MTLTQDDLDAVARAIEADLAGEDAARYAPHYNIAPTAMHWVVRDGPRRRIVPAAWGIVAPERPLVINARAETVASRPLFRESFARRRCLVPADGFFEWLGDKSDRRPIWFHAPDRGVLLFAGLFEEDPQGRLTFAVLTTPANDVVAPVHDRMPALLDPDGARAWLERPERALLRPAPSAALIATPVSRRVNSAANDDPECLAPPEPVKGQIRLI